MAKVHEAIIAVMRKVGAISKDKKAMGYAFRGIDQFMNTLHPLMAEEGLFAIPKCKSIVREERTSKNGSQLLYSVMEVEYSFSADDGSCLNATVYGEAMDSGDKSCNKAMSAALKYLLMQVFMVPTELIQDPDADVYELRNDVVFNATDSLAAFKELLAYFENTVEGDKTKARKRLAIIRGVDDPGDTGKLMRLMLEPLGARFTAKTVTGITEEAIEDVKERIKEVAKDV